MKKKKLKALVQTWMRQSNEDELIGRDWHTVRVEMKATARTRRNCAWELLRLLDDAEKENPSEEGPVRFSNTDCESV